MCSEFNQLSERYERFVDERDWDRYHTPQNLAMALSVEANELLELFLWFNNPSSEEVRADNNLVEEAEAELADVFIYGLGLATQLDIDSAEAIEAKLDENEERFDEERVAAIEEQLAEWQ